MSKNGVIVCSECKKPFRYADHHLRILGAKEKEPVDCPYCGHTEAEWTSSAWWDTSQMPRDEQDQWLKDNPGVKIS
ncbi:hypothetical protein MesloDRAFT_1194 [Mesorhizobium japonicum R7A]|nr:hypothetical protein MesloDRAFT_1194 [Mesorhizobium japonicum R7A]